MELLALLGLGYLASRKEKKEKKDRKPAPKPLPVEGDDYRVEFVETGENGQGIYLLQSRRGVLYDDGSGGYSWEDSGYIIGEEGVGYRSAPKSIGGTMTFEIAGVLYENVLVYQLDAARDATKEEEDDGTGPVKPPEEEEPPTQPSLPVQPKLPGFSGDVSWNAGWY